MLEKRDVVNFISKFLSFAINIIITFFVSSFVIKQIGSEAYGFVGLANEFVGYAQVISIALNSMASRFIAIEAERNNNDSVNQYSSSLFIMNILLAILIGSFSSVFIIYLEKFINISAENVWDVKVLWGFILSNFLLSLLGTVFQIATFFRRRLELEALQNTISSILKAFVLIVCYRFFPTYIWYVGLATLVSTLYLVLKNIKYTHQLMPNMKIRAKYFRIGKVLTLIKSGLWNSLTQLGVILSSGLDLLVTNLFISSTAMGMLSVAKTLPKYIYSLVNNLAGAFAPNYVLLVANKDEKGIEKQIKITVKIMSFFTIIALTLFISLGKNIYYLWVPSMDIDSLFKISLVAAIGYLAVMPFEVLWSVFSAKNKVKVSSIYLIIESFLNVTIELILIQFTNDYVLKMIIIVGITSFLMFLRAFVFMPLYTARITNIRITFLYSILIRNLLIFTVLALFGTQIMGFVANYSWCTFIFGGVFITFFTAIICFFVLFNSNERKSFRERLFLKKRRPW